MRHRKKTVKLQRKSSHRKSMLANLVCSLIEHKRIKTTLAKAKAVRPYAEKMLTLGKKANACEEKKDKTHYFNIAVSFLKHRSYVKVLFDEIVPTFVDRQGGYTRVIKLGPRLSDSAPMGLVEWVDYQNIDQQDSNEDTEDLKKESKQANDAIDANENDKETSVKNDKKVVEGEIVEDGSVEDVSQNDEKK